jgi:hypothetical protein
VPRANSTTRPSAWVPAAIRVESVLSGAPREDHVSHESRPGPVCRRCQMFPSPVTVNSSKDPWSLRVTTGSPGDGGPGASSEDQSDQPPLGTVCQRCHTLPSFDWTNSSSRPSVFEPTVGGDQSWRTGAHQVFPVSAIPARGPCPGVGCQRCHSVPSVILVNSSSRPS